MKIDTDTLTIIDDETIRMETNLPRQEFDGGRDKLEQFGWKIIEPHSLQTKITRRKANEAMLRKKINIDAGVTAFMDRTFAEGDIEISDPKMNVKSRLQRMWATSRPYLPYVGAVGAAVAGVVCAFFPGQVPILGPSLSQQVFNEFTFNLPIAATGAGIVFGTAQIVKSAAKSYEIPTKNLAQQAFDEAKLEWLSEKAEQFELYVPPEISNDPVEFERWLKAETQRKGLEFESDIPYHRIQWKGFKKYVKRTSGKWASSGINNREAVRRANEQFADLLRNELRETVQEWFPGTEMDQFLDMVMGDPLFIHHKFELDKPIDSFKKVESLLDLMYHIDNLMIKDLDDFQEARLDDLKGSLRKRIKDIIFEQDLLSGFSKYSKNLFERFYRKVFPEVGQSDLYPDLEMISFGLDILWLVERYYGDSFRYTHIPQVVKELINHEVFRDQSDIFSSILNPYTSLIILGHINQFTRQIWGKNYRQLLVERCKIEQSTDVDYIRELEDNNVKFSKKDIIWTTKNSEGKIIWLELGSHNYDNPDQGAGLEHIFQKHKRDQFEDWGFNTPKQQAKFLLDIISDPSQEYRIDDEDNYVYRVDTPLKGRQYLALQIGSNGFIVTARPYSYEEGEILFNKNS